MSLLSLTSYKELLNKCKKELSELELCSVHPDYDYTLFNIVLSLNHLFEWYLKDKDVVDTRKNECISLLNPFNDLTKVSYDFKELYDSLKTFPKTNKYQEVIRLLCNKAKHFKKRNLEKQEKHYTSVCGSPTMAAGGEFAYCGAYDHYLYYVEIKGQDIDLITIINTLINTWIDFIKN